MGEKYSRGFYGELIAGLLLTVILLLGVYMILRPGPAAKAIRNFYSDYPIIRRASQEQLTVRPIFIRLIGLVFVAFPLLLILSSLF
jgi:hypothetical protein